MERYWEGIIIAVIFILTVGIRLTIAFSTPHVLGEESYFHLRQIEAIQETGNPLYYDDLSFSGRRQVFSPLYDYALASLAFIVPLEYVVKVVPNLIAALLIVFTYLIARKITDESYVRLLTAFLSGFIPLFFATTVNSLSVYSLILPLFALLIYCFLTIEKQGALITYIITLTIFTLIHPTVVVFILGLIVYWLLQKAYDLDVTKREIEIIIFSLCFVIFTQWVIHRNLLLEYGLNLFWQNIPEKILGQYFYDLTWLEVMYKIGQLPFVFGFVIMYKYFFKGKTKVMSLLIGFALATGALLWLQLIQPNPGMMFFGFILVLLFCQYYTSYLSYFIQTKFSGFLTVVKILLMFTFISTSVYPSISLALDEQENNILLQDLKSLEWIKKNTEENAIILSTIEEGHLITAISKRKNVVDGNFLLVPDAEERFDDVNTVWTTPIQTTAVDILNKYNVSYIYVTPFAKQKYNFTTLESVDRKCFERVYRDAASIYQTRCRVE